MGKGASNWMCLCCKKVSGGLRSFKIGSDYKFYLRSIKKSFFTNKNISLTSCNVFVLKQIKNFCTHLVWMFQNFNSWSHYQQKTQSFGCFKLLFWSVNHYDFYLKYLHVHFVF